MIAAIWPEVFMVALTVAECSRPMSTQVLHDAAVVSMQVATVSANSTAAVLGSGVCVAATTNSAATP